MFRWFLASLAIAIAASAAEAAFVVNVYPSIAPATGNSASDTAYNSWVANGVSALESLVAGGYGTAGTPTVPGFYSTTSYTNGGSINYLTTTPNPFQGGVTGLFNGNINGSAAGYLGNKFYFGVTVVGAGITANAITFNGITSTDSGTASFFNNGPTPIPVPLSSVVGSNGLYGETSPGTWQKITNAATPYQAIIYTGVSNGFGETYGSDYNSTSDLNSLFQPTPFTAPNGFVEYVPGQTISGSYTAGTNTGFGTLDVNNSPAPATFLLMGLGFGGIVARVRRRTAVAA